MTDVASELGGTTAPLKGIRRSAARQMVRAWQAPMFSLTVAIDMTTTLAVKQPETTVTDRLVSGVAAALRRNPGLNAWYGEEGITTFERQNIGIAVATEGGLVVPVIHDAGGLEQDEIAMARREVVAKARDGRLSMADVTGGTFTISNLGMLGVDRFVAIVNPPQVGILAVGATRDRYVRVDGTEQWRPVADFTLSCDHRAVDGALGAAFLADLKGILEQP